MVWFQHDSPLLAACNPLGDPVRRSFPVYLPAAYEAEPGRHFPVLWSLAAYTSSGPAQVAWRNHAETLPERMDRLIEQGMPPAIVVMPDSYTSLGGNQFVDSPALGSYARWLVEELVPAIDRQFRTVDQPAGRALFGKSSGGFGALHLAMRHPGVFAAVASHAGDCGFDRVYLPDFADCAAELAAVDGDPAAFVRAFWHARRPGGRAFHALMVLCLAASYSPRPDFPLGLQLPFDPHTLRLDAEVWERWLAFDPLSADAGELDALAGLTGLWIDVGARDQYRIQYGTREWVDRLVAAGIAHRYQEFDGDHSGMDWRFDHSLPWLLARLKQD
ncbi:MAG: alpha/beta hydrolase-fold protein [Wenzhouxiangellaceae bacterium]|nr:alpha/beta hydrolase-fold protein [Wenzhouxiangellaceae bacterium]